MRKRENIIIPFLHKLRSKDGRTLTKNFVSLSLLQVAGYIFPLITLPYLAKVLGIYNFGAVAFANTIIIYFQTLVDYGFIYSSVRDISQCGKDKDKVSYIFSTVMYARFILTVVAFLILCVLIFTVPFFYEKRIVLFCTFLLIPGYTIFADWFFQGIEKMFYITIGNLITKLLFTVLVFVFIKEPGDYYLQPLLTAFGYVIAGVYSIFVIYGYGYKFVKVPSKDVIFAIKSNTDLFLNQLFPNLYNSFSVFLLGTFHGNMANGMYEAGGRFLNIFLQFTNVVARTFFPFLARKEDAHGKYAKFNVILSLVLTFLLFIFSPFMIRVLFTDEYNEALYVLQILSFSIFFLTVSNVYGTSYLVIRGYEKEQRQAVMTASVLGFFIGMPLVYYFSYIGAAVTVTVARGLIALFVYIKYLRLCRNA